MLDAGVDAQITLDDGGLTELISVFGGLLLQFVILVKIFVLTRFSHFYFRFIIIKIAIGNVVFIWFECILLFFLFLILALFIDLVAVFGSQELLDDKILVHVLDEL